MDIKDSIDLIGKKIDIIKAKLFGFFAASGGSFVYIVKEDLSIFVTVGSLIIFLLGSYGIIINLRKFTDLYIQLERIENDIY